MARKAGSKARPAELQRYSRGLNKSRMAAIMAVVGLLFVAGAKFFLPPEWMQAALMVFVVGVASALLSVGGTYVGYCPHCGAKTAFNNAFGLKKTKCARCAKPIVVNRTKEGFFFRRK